MATDEQILQALQTMKFELAELLRSGSGTPVARNGNGWSIATFASIILALTTIGAGAISSLDDKLMLISQHQQDRADDLDEMLQKEIAAARGIVEAKFDEADKSSNTRHHDQQEEIDEIKAWFKAPALRNNSVE